MLNEILNYKRQETAKRKEQHPIGTLLDKAREETPPSFSEALSRDGLNIIAEIKYKSPSHGPFRCQKPPEEVAEAYIQNGAAALSILTDENYFSGSLENLKRVRERFKQHAGRSGDGEEESESAAKETHHSTRYAARGPLSNGQTFERIPLLRKDFILDRYQVAEARAFGASAYLLIAAALQQRELVELMGYGKELGLEALVEVHDAFELECAIESGSRIIGVNNRNLKTFNVNIKTSFEIARRLEGESGYILVAESGLSTHSQLEELRDAGFNAFLIGTTFMETDDPGAALAELLGT